MPLDLDSDKEVPRLDDGLVRVAGLKNMGAQVRPLNNKLFLIVADS